MKPVLAGIGFVYYCTFFYFKFIDFEKILK